jgi:hypothetical protein
VLLLRCASLRCGEAQAFADASSPVAMVAQGPISTGRRSYRMPVSTTTLTCANAPSVTVTSTGLAYPMPPMSVTASTE